MSFHVRRLALLTSLPAVIALAGCEEKPQAVITGEQVRAYLMENPQVIEEALTKLQADRKAEADTQIRKAIADNKQKLERDGRDFVAGNPNGKITIVEFFDYRCPYCKAAMPEIQKLLDENDDIRLVLKEYPILTPASEAASRAAIAAKAQGKYWEVHKDLMSEMNLDDAVIRDVLEAHDVKVDQALRTAASPQTASQLTDIHELARVTGVSGTPAFIIGDQMVAGWMPGAIQEAVETARKAPPPQAQSKG